MQRERPMSSSMRGPASQPLPPAQLHAGGIPTSVVVSPDSLPLDLICVICSDMCDNPVVTPCCHHVFCNSCMARARLHNNELCPIDRQQLPLNIPSLKAACPPLHRLWNGILLRCPYASLLNCAWSGCGEDYPVHAAACRARAEAASNASAANQATELRARMQALELELQGLRRGSASAASAEQSAANLMVANEALRQANGRIATLHAAVRELEADKARLAASNSQLRQAMSQQQGSVVSVDAYYQYNRFRVSELARLILQDLQEPPADVIANRIFICIRNIHADYLRGWQDNPEELERELAMLIAVAVASGWFTDKQYGLLEDMKSQLPH